MEDLGHSTMMMMLSRWILNKLPSRTSPPKVSGCAPSSVSPGNHQVHVLAGVGPWVIRGSSMVNTTDWTTVLIRSNRPIIGPKLGPDDGGSRCGKY